MSTSTLSRARSVSALAALVPLRGRAWSWIHALAWVIGVYLVLYAIGDGVARGAYEGGYDAYAAATQGVGAMHLLLIVAVGLVVWRKADRARTRALGIIALSVLSVLPVLTWGAWAAMPWLLTAEGLDWPMKRRTQLPVGSAVIAPVEGSQPDIVATLQGLADLRDRRAISADEYEAKKAELLARI